MRQLQTSTLSNQNIASYLLTATYTADAARALLVSVVLDQVAGSGDYYAYVTRQLAGAGSHYMIGPITTFTVPAATTAVAFSSVLVPVDSGDVVKVYVKGVAGDTTTPDIITRFYELTYLRPTVEGRTLDVSAGGEAGIDWANIGSPTTTVNLTNTTVANLTNERGKYANGSVWIGPAANTNTASYTDGIITNPVSTIAAAKTIADALGMRRFEIIRTGTVQIGAALAGYRLSGVGWTCTTTGGSQDVGTTAFLGGNVTGGTYASTSGTINWVDCEFSTGVTVGVSNMIGCRFQGTLTLSTAGNYDFVDCASVVAGTGTPVFAVPAGTVNVSFRRWSGGIRITGITSGTTVSIDMVSGGTVTLEGADGNVQVRGMCAGITDSRTGTPTLGQNAALNRTTLATPTNITAATGINVTLIEGVDATDQLDAHGGGLTAQEVRDAMKLAPTAGSPAAGSVDKHLDDLPTAAQIDTQLSGTHGSGSWAGAGSGSVEWDYVVTDDNVDPIPDAFVYVTARGSGILLASGYTDETGTVTFMLDPGEYDFYTRKGGYNFTNPDQETVA